MFRGFNFGTGLFAGLFEPHCIVFRENFWVLTSEIISLIKFCKSLPQLSINKMKIEL